MLLKGFVLECFDSKVVPINYRAHEQTPSNGSEQRSLKHEKYEMFIDIATAFDFMFLEIFTADGFKSTQLENFMHITEKRVLFTKQNHH